jgi:hypothetical protein
VRLRRTVVGAFFVWLAVIAGVGCGIIADPSPPVPVALDPAVPVLPGQSTDIFTTARPTFGAALNDFLYRTPDPVQPLEFPHNIHVGKEIACDFCHAGVATGPRAGIPGVNTCMICHAAIATDRPRIQQITKMQAEGRDLAWQRVYGYPAAAHVRFNHAPHIRAKVECSTCHGNVGEQTVAQRSVDLNMGFCVNCHNENKAPVDCMTCHF